MTRQATDPISAWFVAAQELGEFVGIRFGRIPPGADEPEWIFLPHTDFDGIGGLAEIFRRRGVKVDRLPQLRHPLAPSWVSLVRALPKYFGPRRGIKWGAVERGAANGDWAHPPTAVAWHVFDEEVTTRIRQVCRKAEFTVNSFLLQHLTKAIRPSLEDPASAVSWMIPVNIRGKVDRGRDTAVHTSYVGVKVGSGERVQSIHRNVYAALQRGEHWANWHLYLLGRFITPGLRRYLVATGWGGFQRNLGSFSNLGDWDPDQAITEPDCLGAWLFCPPVLQMLPVGTGCATFQNRLSLTIQAHPSLTTDPSVPGAWVKNWVKEIEMDLAGIR
jgi:hypothetical protein